MNIDINTEYNIRHINTLPNLKKTAQSNIIYVTVSTRIRHQTHLQSEMSVL
jgi:hypothetical protein